MAAAPSSRLLRISCNCNWKLMVVHLRLGAWQGSLVPCTRSCYDEATTGGRRATWSSAGCGRDPGREMPGKLWLIARE